jgi:hypothetical protein
LLLVSDGRLCHPAHIMRRPVIILVICLLAGFLAWSEWRHTDETVKSAAADPHAEPSSPILETHEPPAGNEGVAPAVPTAQNAAISAQLTVPADDKTGPRYKRAYMLSLDKGALTFLQAQDIEGDFAPKRRQPEEWSGMLRCRLLSDTREILAEELLPAPDHLCAVLDPKSGSDKPVPYTAAGPVVFQVRLPRVKGAARLDIIRIIQPGEPPLEGLLGSIPLPRS